MATEFENFDYVDLNQVDPTVKPVEANEYTLKVLKLTPATTSTNKPYIKGVFAITKDQKFSGRKLYHNWFRLYKEDGSIDVDGYQIKDFRRLMDVTGVKQNGGFTKWLEEVSQVGPEFKAPVGQRPKTEKTGEINPETGKNVYTTVINPVTGEPETENVIDFRHLGIA